MGFPCLGKLPCNVFILLLTIASRNVGCIVTITSTIIVINDIVISIILITISLWGGGGGVQNNSMIRDPYHG